MQTNEARGDRFDFEDSSKGHDVGWLGRKHLPERWVLKSGAVFWGTSNSVSGVSADVAQTYTLPPTNSLSVVGTYTDNRIGGRRQLGVSHTLET